LIRSLQSNRIIDAPRSAWHDRKLVLVQGGQSLRIQLQMRLYQFGRRQRQPLVQRNVGIVAALEDFQKAERRRAGIFDVMAHRERHVTNVAGLEIESARLT
jgi:hypothetical protein